MVPHLFKLIDLPNGRWGVSWPERGIVKTHAHKELFVEFAFQSGASLVVLADSDGDLVYLEDILWMNKSFKLAVAVEMVKDLVAVQVDTLEQAEKFIESAEKHIMWRALIKKHDTQ